MSYLALCLGLPRIALASEYSKSHFLSNPVRVSTIINLIIARESSTFLSSLPSCISSNVIYGIFFSLISLIIMKIFIYIFSVQLLCSLNLLIHSLKWLVIHWFYQRISISSCSLVSIHPLQLVFPSVCILSSPNRTTKFWFLFPSVCCKPAQSHLSANLFVLLQVLHSPYALMASFPSFLLHCINVSYPHCVPLMMR